MGEGEQVSPHCKADHVRGGAGIRLSKSMGGVASKGEKNTAWEGSKNRSLHSIGWFGRSSDWGDE